MSSTTVRVDEQVRKQLKEIAEREGVSVQFIIQKVVNFYQKYLFLHDLNLAYAKVKPETDSLWDSVINDGLDNEEWNEHGELVKKAGKNV